MKPEAILEKIIIALKIKNKEQKSIIKSLKISLAEQERIVGKLINEIKSLEDEGVYRDG